MTSQTIANILDEFVANTLLNTAAPPLMPASPGDMRVSHPAGQPNQPAIEAATRALQSGQTHYVDVPGIGPLREALSDYLSTSMGTPYAMADILVTAGIQEARFLTLQKIGENFEKILIPAVVEPGVLHALGVRQLPLIRLAVDPETMLPTLKSIEEAFAAGGRLLFLESPSRLSGKAYNTAEVAELARLVREYETAVIWDQGLAPWLASGKYSSLAAQDGMADRVAVLGEAWPGAGLDSWFIGYIAAPPNWFEPMRSQKQIMAICTATASQYAALEAAGSFAELHLEQLEQLQQQGQVVRDSVAKLNAIPLPGDTASLIALRMLPQKKEQALSALSSAGYQAADGSDFGAPDVIRLAITLDNNTEQALQSLGENGKVF